MAATVQITRLTTYATPPSTVAKVEVVSLQTLGQAPAVAGNGYFKRGGVWVHATVARRVRVGGAWVTL